MEAGTQPGKIHRALADEHRLQIVDELRRMPAGVDVQELARRLELHPNTVRWHLGILSEAGLVTSHPEVRTRPGRPRIAYRLSDETDTGDADSYRLLATMLSGALSELEDGTARAEKAGHSWGRYLAKRPPPHVRVTDEAATQGVVDLLAEHGFRPEAREREIRMHHCPFRELAPGVVCALHRGLIGGALAEMDSGLEVGRLDAFVEPGLCIARLRSSSPAAQEPAGDAAPPPA